MSVAAERTERAEPRVRTRVRSRRSPIWKKARRLLFYLLVALIFVYALFPFLLGAAFRLHAGERSLPDAGRVHPVQPDP